MLQLLNSIKNFTFDEMIKTDTGFKNIPKSPYVVLNIIKMMSILQEIRDELGIPVIVNSGYRSFEVNEKVGGVRNSFHTYGCAADITCNSSDFNSLVEICMSLDYDCRFAECIVYPDNKFIHIACYPVDKTQLIAGL